MHKDLKKIITLKEEEQVPEEEVVVNLPYKVHQIEII
jgi:hypothetical protein